MYAKYPHIGPIEKGVKLVMKRQLPVSFLHTSVNEGILSNRECTTQDGSWPQEAIEGVFNKSCAISYPNFKFSFPIWMLGKAHTYLEDLRKRS